MRNHFISCIAALCIVSLANAQGDAKLSVEVSKNEVQAGERFEVKFVLENGNNAKFVPPDWESNGFSVVNTSQSSNFSFSNGVSSSTAVFKYQIFARDSGDFEIPAVQVKAGGADLKTTAQIIHVLPGVGNFSEPPTEEPGFAPPAQDPKKKIKTIRI